MRPKVAAIQGRPGDEGSAAEATHSTHHRGRRPERTGPNNSGERGGCRRSPRRHDEHGEGGSFDDRVAGLSQSFRAVVTSTVGAHDDERCRQLRGDLDDHVVGVTARDHQLRGCRDAALGEVVGGALGRRVGRCRVVGVVAGWAVPKAAGSRGPRTRSQSGRIWAPAVPSRRAAASRRTWRDVGVGGGLEGEQPDLGAVAVGDSSRVSDRRRRPGRRRRLGRGRGRLCRRWRTCG